MIKIRIHWCLLLLYISVGVRSDFSETGTIANQNEDASLHPVVTIQDVKNYIQPIVYQKLLRTPGDSQVVQQAKAVVAEYLVDTLLESAQNPEDLESAKPQKDSKQAASANGTATSVASATSRPSTILNVVSGTLNITRPRPSQQHVIGQVDRIIQNVNGANITGIVDQALRIRAPPGVRQLVNGIMNLVLCNPFNRLWNRCPGGGGLIDSIAGR